MTLASSAEQSTPASSGREHRRRQIRHPGAVPQQRQAVAEHRYVRRALVAGARVPQRDRGAAAGHKGGRAVAAQPRAVLQRRELRADLCGMQGSALRSPGRPMPHGLLTLKTHIPLAHPFMVTLPFLA